ncbi:MAG: type VI secretion system baseplate subunit TssF [Actinomycetota bacterium]|nr:type VI secretion system baseplate subunit TssF [Actinomycetota bacterium]
MAGVKLKMFAALLLRAMAQEQAENGTERVSPRHPNVARRLGLEPDRPELATAERYLESEGYIRPSAPDHKGDYYTITEMGWEELGYQHSEGEWRRRPWWRRMLGV